MDRGLKFSRSQNGQAFNPRITRRGSSKGIDTGGKRLGLSRAQPACIIVKRSW